MDSELHQQVLQWKNKLEHEHREEKILRLLQKLHRVPVSIDLLMATEIGKVVNKMKKRDGEIGNQARHLVSQWKEIVSSQRSAPDKIEEDTRANDNPYLSLSNNKYEIGNYDPDNSFDDYNNFRKSNKVTKGTKNVDEDKHNSYKKPKSEKIYAHSDKRKDDREQKHRSKNGHGDSSNGSSIKKKSSHSDTNSKYSPEKSSKTNNHSPSKCSSSPLKRKSESNKLKASKKNLKEQDNFDNQTASFEACLGFNDVVSTKRKKPNMSTSANHSRNKLSHSNSKHSKESTNQHKVKSRNSLPPKEDIQEKVTKVDILSTLPEIQPDYKPTPRYDPPSLRMGNHKPEPEPFDEDAFTNSKSSRTKLYSGRANNFVPEVLTLQDFCVRVLSDNIDSIRYLGNVPYFIIKPVLDNCTATQLYAIEYFNPYLVEETDELWQLLAAKQFRGKSPDEMETWRELFLRLSDEREAKLKSITANITASMAKANPVRQTKLAYVDTVAKPPRNVARAQARQGTGLPVGYKMKAGPPGHGSARPKAPAINAAHHSASSSSSNHVSAQKKIKTAPLMQKTLKFMKNRFRR